MDNTKQIRKFYTFSISEHLNLVNDKYFVNNFNWVLCVQINNSQYLVFLFCFVLFCSITIHYTRIWLNLQRLNLCLNMENSAYPNLLIFYCACFILIVFSYGVARTKSKILRYFFALMIGAVFFTY
jgi:phosphatidylglycerophosphate synthase